MKAFQMTLEEDLVKKVDLTAKKLHTTRSAFTRQALVLAMEHIETLQLEAKHRSNYLKRPPAPDEFGVWEKEQAWGEV
jgi:metal-responsive CopG/Arc/MetJ family transcriptional regulator